MTMPAPDQVPGPILLFGLPNGLNGYYIAESVPGENGKRLVRLAASAPAESAAPAAAAMAAGGPVAARSTMPKHDFLLSG